jgi:dihydroflavonol-4-reductase
MASPLDIITRWPYYASKFYQERVALESFTGSGLRLVILNPSLLLGPGDERLSSTKVILDFLARKISAVPGGGLNFVDVRDAAKVFPRDGRRPSCGTLSDGKRQLEFRQILRAPRTFDEDARAAFSFRRSWQSAARKFFTRFIVIGISTPPVEPTSVEMAEYFWYLDASKAARELAFTTRDAGETLRKQSRMCVRVFSAEMPSEWQAKAFNQP